MARFPSEAGARIALGAAQMGAGDSAAAAEAYNVAAVLDPARLEARLGLALALLQAGRAGEALDAALAATAIEPASPDAWFAKGAACARCGGPATRSRRSSGRPRSIRPAPQRS